MKQGRIESTKTVVSRIDHCKTAARSRIPSKPGLNRRKKLTFCKKCAKPQREAKKSRPRTAATSRCTEPRPAPNHRKVSFKEAWKAPNLRNVSFKDACLGQFRAVPRVPRSAWLGKNPRGVSLKGRRRCPFNQPLRGFRHARRRSPPFNQPLRGFRHAKADIFSL